MKPDRALLDEDDYEAAAAAARRWGAYYVLAVMVAVLAVMVAVTFCSVNEPAIVCVNNGDQTVTCSTTATRLPL